MLNAVKLYIFKFKKFTSSKYKDKAVPCPYICIGKY